MIKRTLCIAALTLTVCNAETAISEDVTISNFKSGLACPFTALPDGRLERDGFICVETEEIFITGQSRCNFDGDIYPCTWYGFEFEYKNNSNTVQQIRCLVESNEARTFGNPNSKSERSTKSYEYEIEIQTGSGRFYNPQYSSFGENRTSTSRTVCYAGDVELFELKRKFINP